MGRRSSSWSKDMVCGCEALYRDAKRKGAWLPEGSISGKSEETEQSELSLPSSPSKEGFKPGLQGGMSSQAVVQSEEVTEGFLPSLDEVVASPLFRFPIPFTSPWVSALKFSHMYPGGCPSGFLI